MHIQDIEFTDLKSSLDLLVSEIWDLNVENATLRGDLIASKERVFSFEFNLNF